MDILIIYEQGQPHIKYHVMKHLELPVIQNIMDIKEDLIQWFTNSFDKDFKGSGATCAEIASED